MKSQTERIYEVLANIRPFALTANVIHFAVNDSTVENRGLPRIPKVSVNRALNELAKRGLVMKKNKLEDGGEGRKVHPWRATYKEVT